MRAGLACPKFSWMPRAAFQSILLVQPGSWRVRTQSSAFSPLSGKLWISGTRCSNCVVRNSGLLDCSAYNKYKQSGVPADLGPVLAVAAGGWHTCAVRTDGQLVCFEDNMFNQLCQQIWDQFWQFSAGDAHTCAVRTDGQLVCFGEYYLEKCCVPADLGPVLPAASGQFHTCAVRADTQALNMNTATKNSAGSFILNKQVMSKHTEFMTAI